MTVPAVRAEEARAAMIELFPEGFEEFDANGALELAAYTDAGGEERLWTAFGGVSTSEVADDWDDRWRRFHRPVRVGALWVGPRWELPDEDAHAVVIEPARAFGTGAHPTTRLVLELLQALAPGSLLDAGCGSGVLSVAAAKLGFAPVTALDVEPQAVEAARENASVNGGDVDVREADVLRDRLPRADVVVANVTLAVAEQLAARVRSDVLVVSGYLAADRPALDGWRHRARREQEGWAADRFDRG